MKHAKSLKLALRGGKVKRYHTMPSIEQSVAEHTFNVCHVLEYITEGKCSKAMIMNALNHDIAECETGDTPHYSKRRNGDLKTILDNMEKEVLYENNVKTYILTEKEKKLIKLADLCEMGLYALHLNDIGNKKSHFILYNVVSALFVLKPVGKKFDNRKVQELYELFDTTWKNLPIIKETF